MSSTKAFNINVKPRDVLVDIKGLPDYATNAYIRFWMLHALHGEPLPPREEKKPRAEWDAWFRDKLDMKNVRTWIKARDELLRLAKLRMTDDGRLYIGRTMRDVEKRRGGDLGKWGGETDEPEFDLCGVHAAQRAAGAAAKRSAESPPCGALQAVDRPVGEAVEDAGELPASAEVRANIGQTSPDVPPILLPNPLIYRRRRPASSYSYSKSLHEVVVAIPFGSPRARGDPAARQA